MTRSNWAFGGAVKNDEVGLTPALRICLLTIVLASCDQGRIQTTTNENPTSHLDTVEPAFTDDPSSALFEPNPTEQIEAAHSSLDSSSTGLTYYVSKDGNDTDGRSKATAFKMIQQAANLVKPGDTVLVLAGTYKEWVKNTRDGTALARIRFVSEPRGAAKIIPTKDALAFWSSDGDYTDIEGFTFDGSLGDLPHFAVRAIQANGTSSRIMYNNIRLFRACTPELYGRGGVGVGIGGYTTNFNSEVFGNFIRNTRLTGCPIAPYEITNSSGTYYFGEVAGYGIYLSTPNAKAYNNIIFDTRIGIHLWHAPTGNIVSHNLVFNIGPTGVGIVFGCGDKPYVQCHDITVSNNILMYTKGVFAIREYGNNAQQGNRILNNIIFMNTTNSGSVSKAIDFVASPIISGNWVGVDPKLVNFKLDGTGDYRLTAGSPAIDAASVSGAVAKDLVLTSRPSGKADIGPYEFAGVAAPTPRAPTTFEVR